jgi:putative copper resistance protein D
VGVPDPEFLVAPDPTDGDRAPAALGRPESGPDQGGVILDTIAPVEKAPAATEADRAAGARRWRIGVLIATAALVTACVAVALAAIVPARALIQGLPDAGEFTQLALPAVTGLFNLMAAVTIGWLLGAAALAPPQKSGIVDVGGYRCLRAASLAAVVWAASGLALIPLTVADALGRSLADAVEMSTLSTALSVLTSARAALIAVGIAVVIAIASRIVMRIGWVFALLSLALFALVPIALGGHAGQPADHDFAVDSMIFHLFGAALWVGGLIALIGLAKQRVKHIDVVAHRYSTLALIAIVAVAISGVINAMLRVSGPAQMWSTAYGRLVATKIALLVILGVVGYLHRRRTLPLIRDGRPGPLVRLASVEVVIMAITVGVAATLSRTATPPAAGIAPSSDAALVLGFELPGPPSLSNLMFFWRFDLIAGTAAVVLAALYVAAVIRLRRRGDTWPIGRTIGWLLGCVTLLWSTSSGLAAYGQVMFSMHMIEHMFLAMLVPIFLALGGPVTLLLRALPAAGPGDPPGVREAVVGFVHSPVTRFLTHPLVVLPLFVASFYALYFTNLFGVMISSHPGHLFMTIHFVLTGYLYYWVIIGVDPSPRKLSSPIKLALVLAAMPFHAFFGLALMSSHHLLAADYFARVAVPWVGDLLANQQMGGAIGWGFTEIPLVVVMLALMAQWARSDERQAARDARKAELTHDADLVAYNAMLATLAKRDDSARR